MTNNKESFSHSYLNQENLVKNNGYHKEAYYEELQIPLETINILPQPRKTFEKIDELANDILEKGLINPLLLARFNRENCEKYLKAINILWKKEIKKAIKTENLNRNPDDNHYYILIAGERRLRAIKHLKKENLINKIFPQEKIDVRVFNNPSPLEALFRQASENIHQRPPAHEEAEFYASLLHIIREEKENYPTTRFAKDVGKDPETIRKAVQFSLLPRFAQKAVIKNNLVYGVACELGKMLKDFNPKVNFKEEEINLMAVKAMVGHWTIKRCRQEVRKKIEEAKSDQGSFKIFTKKDQEKLERLSLKNSATKEIIKGSWDFIIYLRRINFLIKERKLSAKDSLFTEKHFTKAFLLLINEQEKLLPHLGKITEEEKKRIKKVIEESKEKIKEIIVYQNLTKENNLS